VIREYNSQQRFFVVVDEVMPFEWRMAHGRWVGCCAEPVLPKIYPVRRYQEKGTWMKDFYPAQWLTLMDRANKPD
jgi:hypothetical protein